MILFFGPMNLINFSFVFSHVFRDRLQTQEEISQLLVSVFAEKQRINYEEYSNVNETMTSEMFLSLMTLL